MDAVKFIEERNRMCKSFDKYCYGCPAWDGFCKLEPGSYLKCEAVMEVKIVEKWSAAHPRKTRQSMLLKQYPEGEIDSRGCLMLCPKRISSDCRKRYGNCTNRLCADCRKEFWSQEVE